MNLNLSDPDRIIAWWQVLPDWLSSYLDYKLRASPDFAPAIRAAQRRIANDPALGALLAQAVQQRRQTEAYRAESDGDVPAYELRRRELEAA